MRHGWPVKMIWFIVRSIQQRGCRLRHLAQSLDGSARVMNFGRAQRRVILFLILSAAAVWVGLRFYAQFRHMDVYVSSDEPIPAELAAGLHMAEHKIRPMVRIESPYDSADPGERVLGPEEIGKLRRALAWSSTKPAFVDALIILSPTNAVARQINKASIREYQLIKRGGKWEIEGMTSQEVYRYSADDTRD